MQCQYIEQPDGTRCPRIAITAVNSMFCCEVHTTAPTAAAVVIDDIPAIVAAKLLSGWTVEAITAHHSLESSFITALAARFVARYVSPSPLRIATADALLTIL